MWIKDGQSFYNISNPGLSKCIWLSLCFCLILTNSLPEESFYSANQKTEIKMDAAGISAPRFLLFNTHRYCCLKHDSLLALISVCAGSLMKLSRMEHLSLFFLSLVHQQWIDHIFSWWSWLATKLFQLIYTKFWKQIQCDCEWTLALCHIQFKSYIYP